MKKSLIQIALILFFLSAYLLSPGQNTVKLRISASSAQFFDEPLGEELYFPMVSFFADSLGPFPDFVHKNGLGFQAELMTSLSDKIWLGLEIGSSSMKGENDNPGIFNFQYSDLLQLSFFDSILGITRNAITNYPLKYKTTLFSILGNIRFYPIPEGRFQPFVKVSAGLSLVSTELSLQSPELWIQDLMLTHPKAVPGPGILFSQGTKEAPKGLFPAFTFGGGVGLEYQVNEKIAVYADGTYMVVNADIVDGIPNFDYNEASGMLNRFNTRANSGRISVGITYTLGNNFSIFGGGGKSGSKSGKGGRTSPYLPFYKQVP